MALHKTCPKCGFVIHCKKSVCDECKYVFTSSCKKSWKCIVRDSRSKESSKACELRKASDRERKARKRAGENDDEASFRKMNDKRAKAVVKQMRVN